MSMADLLAKHEEKNFAINRGQELTGEIISITPYEIIFDLGTKSEGVLPKKDLTTLQEETLKVGDKLQVFVVTTENESGQVILSLAKTTTTSKGINLAKWDKFQAAINSSKTFTGKGLEVNRGGLIVEIGDVRGFLPSSQVSLSTVANIEDLIGKELFVTVLEVDPSQNRLILSQKINVSKKAQEELGKLKVGDLVKGEVAAVLPFGVFATLENGVEGLVHISEISWEKIEDPNQYFKVGDKISAVVSSVDSNTNRVNLSIKQTKEDPFQKLASGFQKDDVVKGKVTKVSSNGVFVSLKEGIEGLIPTNKIGVDASYKEGDSVSVLIDNIDTQKRKIFLAPFITSTEGLIYK